MILATESPWYPACTYQVLAILLPILIGNRGWVDPISKFLLVLMMVSIGGFAWIRALAGREEMRTIEQSRG